MKRIPLTNTKLFALISDEDYNLISQFRWRLMKDKWNTYAWRNETIEYPGVFMHRLIFPPPPGMLIDHRNQNGLDNTRENLRHGTNSQNQANSRLAKNNTSGYRGVSRRDRRYKSRPWRVFICHNGHRMTVGFYAMKEDAARAYNAKAKELFGEFARLNPV